MSRQKLRRACVLIPYYKERLDAAERVALARCLEILGAHDIILVKPDPLDVSDLLAAHTSLRTENFSAEYFRDIAGYNRLLLSDAFYARFAQYDYILIHQLDAFVFSDQLLAWCDRGYDYVGAPWLPNGSVPTWRDEYRVQIRCVRARIESLFRERHKRGLPDHMYFVGNGGFSLRRVAKMRAILQALTSHFRSDDIRSGVLNEDVLLTVEARRHLWHMNLPGLREAAGFSWELQPTAAAKLNDGQLPFGCHAWSKLHRDEWRPIFSKLGYSLDELLDAKDAAGFKAGN